MNYDEAVGYIHSLLKFGVKPGFERINALLKALGNPQDKLKYVHVAGTNGKGSICNVLAAALTLSGYKTGLFTSPYVTDFCERIQIDFKMISHDDLTAEVEKIIPLVEELNSKGIEPTEFEVITAMAFDFFAWQSCDIVVLEVGLGGRLDSTNIISTPLVSVITPISYDHMNILGSTLVEIAGEKAGIIKHDGHTVSYPSQADAVMKILRKKCREENNELTVPDKKKTEVLNASLFGTTFSYNRKEYHCAMIGRHQVLNAITAIECCTVLEKQGYHIGYDNFAAALSKCRVPARMEILSENPLIILDGGHNEDCAQALDSALQAFLNGKKIMAVMALMEDKEYEKYLQITSRNFKTVICTKADNPRSLSGASLRSSANNFFNETYSFENVPDAVAKAFSMLKHYDALVVCGSFYLAGEARREIVNRLKTK